MRENHRKKYMAVLRGLLTYVLLCMLSAGCSGIEKQSMSEQETLREKESRRPEAMVCEKDLTAGAAAEEAEADRPQDNTEEKAEEAERKQEKEIGEYQARLEAVSCIEDIRQNGYHIMEEQIFPIELEGFDAKEYSFVPAMDLKYHRLIIFLVDSDGNIVFKTDELEANNRIAGKLKQPTRGLSAVTFSDLNRDGMTDIVLITSCVNTMGTYAGRSYKVGDVLFQGQKTFYRDYRVSDKINRFDMNKSVNCIIAYVRDGHSTEFLYTARTLKELEENGFCMIEEQCYTRKFEKLGKLLVMPGTYRMSVYDIFMIYLVNEQGNIVWSFQPMGSYDNLYSLRGITGKDVDGDGMKDLVVLAKYTYEGPNGELMIESDCAIYYQRTSGFDIDTGFTEYYKCSDEDTMEALIPKIRAYWGWQVTEEAGEETESD